MNTKITIAFAALALFLYTQINSKLDDMILSIDSNANVLVSLRDRQKIQDAADKIAVIKNNIKALDDTECKKCHVLNENLLLPIENNHINYETFLRIVREGGLYMPAFSPESISETKIQQIYTKLYGRKHVTK